MIIELFMVYLKMHSVCQTVYCQMESRLVHNKWERLLEHDIRWSVLRIPHTSRLQLAGKLLFMHT